MHAYICSCRHVYTLEVCSLFLLRNGGDLHETLQRHGKWWHCKAAFWDDFHSKWKKSNAEIGFLAEITNVDGVKHPSALLVVTFYSLSASASSLPPSTLLCVGCWFVRNLDFGSNEAMVVWWWAVGCWSVGEYTFVYVCDVMWSEA